MTQLELKSHFHNGDWWDELSDEQKADIDLSIKECEDEINLIPHEQVKKEARKWLKK
jgi:hypothetical protein